MKILQETVGNRLGAVISDERGGGSFLMMGVIMVVLVVAFVGGLLAAFLNESRHIREVADLAALSAARAQARGQPACDYARQSAEANHARIVDCQIDTGYGEFVVSVDVESDSKIQLPRLGKIKALAKAGIIDE